METLKFGNGNWATKEDSVLAYNDENNNFKPLPFDFTRASTATYVDSDGLIKTSRNGEARIDYTDSSNGALLLEPSRTNSIPYSEDFSSVWVERSVTLTANSLISPDGTQNASTLTINNSTPYLGDLHDIVTTGNTYTISCFVKKGTNRWVRLASYSSAITGAWFDLENGVVGTVNSTSASIEDFGNGWYKIKNTAIVTTGNNQVFIGLSDADGGTSSSQIGNTVHIYGAQIEQGIYATSYIPTNGSSVTRVAETCNNSGNSEVFNDSEGVLFANLNYKNIQSQWSGLGLTDGNDPANRIVLYTVINTKVLRVYLQSGGTVRWTPSFVLNEINQYQKVAIKYKANDNALWLNGFEVALDNTVSIMPTGLDRLGFFSSSNLEPTYASTKELGYYDTALTDLELETLTSYTSWVSMVNALNLNIIYNG